MPKFKYLLDTNILSELIKQPNGYTARKIAHLDNEDLCCTSLIVACELRYGALKKGSHILMTKVNQLLETIAVLPMEQNIESHYAQAYALGLTVVTGNLKEFSRIPDLVVENWLA